MLETKIGEIEEHLGIVEGFELGFWKFIMSKKEDVISFYAGAVLRGGSIAHKNVVEQYGLFDTKIVGGGEMYYVSGSLSFTGFSVDYKLVPNSVMTPIAVRIYDENLIKHPIDSLMVDMQYQPGKSDLNNLKHIEMWKGFGYCFDNRKRNLIN
jgi:hypothetical protein